MGKSLLVLHTIRVIIYWLTDWLIDRPTDWPNDPMTQWPNDPMTEWIVIVFFIVSYSFKRRYWSKYNKGLNIN